MRCASCRSSNRRRRPRALYLVLVRRSTYDADVSFFTAADAYDRFMGRYSRLLSPRLADFAGLGAGQRVLDVGCGPGALTAELVARVGAASVSAVDPSEPFVTAARERFPGVDVRVASAEELPFPDGAFDRTLAQLVVHFMADPESPDSPRCAASPVMGRA